MLLVAPDVTKILTVEQSTASATAALLPDLFADRPLSAAVTTTAALVKPFADASDTTKKRVVVLATPFHTRFAGGTSTELFGANPTSAWQKALTDQLTKLKAIAGVLYLYNHLKDLVDTGNELREVLLTDDTVLCPDPTAFPKHLLLGSLSNPAAEPNPVVPGAARGRRPGQGRPRPLPGREVANAHRDLPAARGPVRNPRATPSRTEAIRLEERAIPIYYKIDSTNPIEKRWNYRLARRNAGASNLGYNAVGYGAPQQAQNPLTVQFARNDFFRVEGHIGQRADTATKSGIE